VQLNFDHHFLQEDWVNSSTL